MSKLSLISCLTFGLVSVALGNDEVSRLECLKQSHQQALEYCTQIYAKGSKSRGHCGQGVSYTFEALLFDEPVEFSDICKPWLLRACDSGRRVMLAHALEQCE